MTWQPIESAPRDGTVILITDGEVVQSGYYESAAGIWRSEAEQCLLWAAPTYWQPLPEPPGD